MRFGSGADIYQATVLSQVNQVGEWASIATPALEFGLSGWIGPNGLTGLSNALASVDWVEVRLERNT